MGALERKVLQQKRYIGKISLQVLCEITRVWTHHVVEMQTVGLTDFKEEKKKQTLALSIYCTDLQNKEKCKKVSRQ